MVAAERSLKGPVLGVLLFELSVLFFLAAQANLVPQAVLLLHLPHLEHHLSGRWAKPLGVQTCHDQRHEEQTHLQDKKRSFTGKQDGGYLLANIVILKKGFSKIVCAGVMSDLHTFVPVQQLSGVVHRVHSQADDVAPHQTVEVYGEEFTLHQAKGVQRYLPHQRKTCRQTPTSRL